MVLMDVSLMTNDIKCVFICHVHLFVKRLILANIFSLLFYLDCLIFFFLIVCSSSSPWSQLPLFLRGHSRD